MNIKPPANSEIGCSDDSDCSGGQTCAPLVGRCVGSLDLVAPRLVSAASSRPTEVDVVFDEPMLLEDLENAALYTMNRSIVVTGAMAGPSGTSVTLSTTPQSQGVPYTVTVGTARDTQGNPLDDTANTAVFTGAGLAPDNTVLEPIAPQDGELLRGLSALFVWTARFGATDYELEVATDSAFSEVIVTQPADDAFTTAPVPGPGEYWWRVRADVTENGAWSAPRRVVLLGDALHVFCAPTATCNNPPLESEIGLATAPLTSLAAAYSRAVTLGIQRINVANRGSGVPYDDRIGANVDAVSFYGGYDAAFDEALRDPIGNQTLISGEGSGTAITNVLDPMEVEGFEITTTLLPGDPSVGIILRGRIENLTIRDCLVRPTAGTDLTIGVNVGIVDSAGADLENVRIEVPTGSLLRFGVNITSGQVNLVGSQIGFEDGTGLVWGVRTQTGGGFSLTDTTIEKPSSTISFTGIGSADLSTALIDRCTVNGTVLLQGQDAASSAVIRNSVLTGVRLTTLPASVIGNTIAVPAAGNALTIEDSNPLVTNNLFWCSDATVAVREWNVGESDALSLQNNAFLGCAALYRDEDTALTITDIATLNGFTETAGVPGCPSPNPCPTVRFENNVTIADTPESFFVDFDGSDDDLDTLLDNDLRFMNASHPAAAAGKDPTGTTCGPLSAPLACWGSLQDRDALPRTLPYSVGAYEADP